MDSPSWKILKAQEELLRRQESEIRTRQTKERRAEIIKARRFFENNGYITANTLSNLNASVVLPFRSLAITYIVYGNDSNLIKIGKSSQVISRLNQLSMNCKETIIPLVLMAGDYEKELLSRFDSIRTKHLVKHGGETEWFLNDGTIVDYIDSLDDTKGK